MWHTAEPPSHAGAAYAAAMGDDKRSARERLAEALGLHKLTGRERADYEPRIHGERAQRKSTPPPATTKRTREHGDGRAAG